MTHKEYLELHHDRFIGELTEFLTFPSISTAPEHAGDVRACGEWLIQHLQSIGIKNAELHETPGHPIVYAEHCEAGPDKPTVLFYGHYDVQPVDPLDLWTDPPFTPVFRDGKVFARGATDDKGQVFLHLKALEALLAIDGTLPINVKILLEGEEEIGSINLPEYIEHNKARLACDAVVVSDTPLYGPGLPSLCYGLRGLCYMEIHVQGPNRDLLTIPGFYDDVIDLSVEERAGYAALPFDSEAFRNGLDVPALFGEAGYTTLEHISGRPTLDVNGLNSGFTGIGAKTVLPAKASAKVSMRLVANQDTEDIAKKFTEHVMNIAPKTVKVEVVNLHGANPVLVERTGKGMNAASRALQKAYGVEPYFTREGGSIPVCIIFDQQLNAPTVLMGFGLQDENAHSPDEHFSLENVRLGMEASLYFYQEMAL
jgi:acetylornithine deacetylase/succinyl-diaminopimelate desuccinylase-like protein